MEFKQFTWCKLRQEVEKQESGKFAKDSKGKETMSQAVQTYAISKKSSPAKKQPVDMVPNVRRQHEIGPFSNCVLWGWTNIHKYPEIFTRSLFPMYTKWPRPGSHDILMVYAKYRYPLRVMRL